MPANTERLVRRMDDLGVDGLIATTYENVHYLTGISSVALEMFPHSGQCFAVVSRTAPAEPYFICSRCEVDQFLDATVQLGGAVGYGQFFREDAADIGELNTDELRLRRLMENFSPDTALAALCWTLDRMGLAKSRVAVDESHIVDGFIDALSEQLPAAVYVPGSDLLRWTRKVKTPDEVHHVAAAANVGEQGLAAVASSIRPGVTERDLVIEFERAVVEAGGRPRFTLIKFGRAAVAGQTLPTDKPLGHGEQIWVDVGGVVNGYWFDLARTFCLGQPSDRLIRYYDAMLAGADHALACARPGMTGGELFEQTVQAVRAAGVPHYRRSHVGHGIGVEVYDQVLLRPNNEDRLEEGTVVNIETPYYEFGFGAVHVEDPFVVGPHVNTLLTAFDRGFSIIE